VTLRESLNQRKSQGEGLWIDACCIDQNDIVEKRHAIAAMDAIYRSAREVFIALEVFSLSDEQGILLQEVLANRFYEGSHDGFLSEEKLRRLSMILIVILSARWFTRAWCSQELQLGVRHVFLIPTESGIITIKPGQLTIYNGIPFQLRSDNPTFLGR
jgi:ABC-type enterochelin transport system permease subunit